MGDCLSVTGDMRRAQREERDSRLMMSVMNVIIGRGHGRQNSSNVIPLEQRLSNVNPFEPTTGFAGPIFTISTRQKDKDKEVDDVEMKAAMRWAGKAKPAGQFLDVEDTTMEFPCVICGEEVLDLKCDNDLMAFLEKVNKKVPGGIQGAKIKPDLLVEMGCCHQTLHVGCLLTWWLTRSHWTCPHCREVYLKGNEKQNYPRYDERQDIIVQQVYDAVTRTIWNLNTDPTDDEDDEFDDDDRFEFTDVSDDDLTTLEGLLGR